MRDRESIKILVNWAIIIALCLGMAWLLQKCAPEVYGAPIPLLVNSNYEGSGYVIGLQWNPSPDTNVTSYNVYFGGESQIYTNITPVGSWTNVGVLAPFNQLVYYAITAENAVGLESVPSKEVEYDRWLPDRVTVTWSTNPPCALLMSVNANAPKSQWTVAQAKPSSGTITVMLGTGSLFFCLQGSTNKLRISASNPKNNP
jgi:hypothetical protein